MTGTPGGPVLPAIASSECICKGVHGWYNPLYYPGPEAGFFPACHGSGGSIVAGGEKSAGKMTGIQ
mgnify:CR=1 FL=1